jgi:quercetin dioxygenase-like cupin family protein
MLRMVPLPRFAGEEEIRNPSPTTVFAGKREEDMFRTLTAATVLALAAASFATAQPSAIKRTVLQSRDFPGEVYRSELIRADIAQGGMVPRHTHPGLEIGFIEHGQALLKVAGQPDRALKTGDSFSVMQGTPHSVANTGAEGLVILSTYVVDKSKPLATPAP